MTCEGDQREVSEGNTQVGDEIRAQALGLVREMKDNFKYTLWWLCEVDIKIYKENVLPDYMISSQHEHFFCLLKLHMKNAHFYLNEFIINFHFKSEPVTLGIRGRDFCRNF